MAKTDKKIHDMLHGKAKKKDNWWDFGTRATSEEQRAKEQRASPGERTRKRQAGRQEGRGRGKGSGIQAAQDTIQLVMWRRRAANIALRHPSQRVEASRGKRERARATAKARAGERCCDFVGSLTGEHYWPWESRGKHDEKFLDKDVPMPWDLCMAPRQPRGTE
jgi:hypothetical protein